jgi:hypothetical protein
VNFAQKLKAYPLHSFGVSLFFITHGYSEYIGLIPFWDLLLCFLGWAAFSTLLLLFFRRRFKSLLAAGLMTSFTVAFLLFFGAFVDGFKKYPALSFLSKYSVLIPLFIVLFIGLYIYYKRSVRKPVKTTFYLNLLFIVFILFDLFSISAAFLGGKTDYLKETEMKIKGLDSFKIKPTDIYLIVADEYAGFSVLRDTFHYANQSFQQHLQEKGFFVAKAPSSNYSYTSLSMASMLNMDYLQWVNTQNGLAVEDYTVGSKLIAESDVVNYLKSQDYEIYNHSIFDLANEPSQFNTGLMSFRLDLITSKTLPSRAKKDLMWHFHKYVVSKIDWLARRFQNDFAEGNQRLVRLTKEVAAKKSERPRFVYTHLEMPHDPYLFDSLGRINLYNYYDQSFNGVLTRTRLKQDYLQYLVYTNKVLSNLADEIIEKTQGKAVVVVMSDHGLRKIKNSSFHNFNAVYLPAGNYGQFYDSVSNVNQFRIIFNALSDQKLPLLKDSMVVF